MIRLLSMGKKLAVKSWHDRAAWKKPDVRRIIWPFRTMFHPIKGYDEIKMERRGSIALTFAVMSLLFIGRSINTVNKGFIFNYVRPGTFDLRLELLMAAAPWALWCVANWSVSSLMNGEGKFREIWIYTFYALMPAAIAQIPLTLLSLALTMDEGMIFSLINTVVYLWVGLMFFIGNMTIHQYTFRMNVLSLFLTLFGMAAILFLMVLLFSLFQQLGIFMATVYKEFMFRF